MFDLLAAIFIVAGVICWLIVTIHAFGDSILKGLFAVFCCYLYWLYYAFFEFQHKNKWAIVIGALFFQGIGAYFYKLAGH